MIVLVSIMTVITIAACVKRCQGVHNYRKFKRSRSFKNFVIAMTEMNDLSIVHYMCKGSVYSYLHHIDQKHNYLETPYISSKEQSNKKIVFATFTNDQDDNIQTVTKKLRKFAGLDCSFHNWSIVPLHVKRVLLKAPRCATNIRYVLGNGEVHNMPLDEIEKDK